MSADLFRDATGRLRVGWRLVWFAGAFLALVVLGFAVLGSPGLVAQAAVMLFAALGAGWWVLRAADGRGPGALGFHASREALGEAGRGLVLGTVVALSAVAAIAVVGGVRWEAEGGTVGGVVDEAVRSLAFFAVPAAAEEALARGYPLQALAEAWGPGIALAVTSAGFGLLHLENPGLTGIAMANLVAAGLLLGVVYLRTGSLWWASGVHLGWNWAHGFVADLPVSGLDLVDAPLWEGIPAGAAWIGGGAFGPEGSVLTTGVALAASAALWWGPWLRPGEAARRARPLTPLPGADPAGAGEAGEGGSAATSEGGG
ncbi:MAG TPA: type II CAAX endopeptidase family protein [Longimicrobiales bacterium]|nr:type II CAAX endopeptidase family protein [Longimicrobiales bacterium]